MDVANYLSELLGEYGEVNVPGLGYFMQRRLDGYYDNGAATFYPPRHTVQFDPQSIDDDVFYRYIAEKKKISLASSKYFTEKYISNLKEEAMLNDVVLADLGSLFSNGSSLGFKPVEVIVNDPAFYGYPQIKLNKLGGTSVFEQMDSMQPPARPRPAPIKPTETTTATESPAETTPSKSEEYISQPGYYLSDAEAAEQEEFVFKGKTYVDDEEERSHKRLWIALLVLLAVAGLGLFGLYKYKPSLFKTPKIAPIILKAPAKPDTGKTVAPVTNDTVKKASGAAKLDTTAKTKSAIAIPQNDTLTQIRYELLGGAFGSVAKANTAINNYKKLGIDARILNNVPGKLYKVTLGTFFVRKDAVDAKSKLVNTGNISDDKITIQPYYPKTNPKQ